MLAGFRDSQPEIQSSWLVRPGAPILSSAWNHVGAASAARGNPTAAIRYAVALWPIPPWRSCRKVVQETSKRLMRLFLVTPVRVSAGLPLVSRSWCRVAVPFPFDPGAIRHGH